MASLYRVSRNWSLRDRGGSARRRRTSPLTATRIIIWVRRTRRS